MELRTKGTPQGGVVSPLLANLFLHYAFDLWMQRNYPSVRFERYADDAIVHCRSKRQAEAVLGAIRDRFAQCSLELHPTKTRIVYCKDDDRRGEHEQVAFDFLGYTFQPRRAKSRYGKFFVSFLPAISTKSAKKIRKTIREWRMASTRNNQRLEDLARLVNPAVRGWMTYYGRFYRSKCVQVLRHLNEALAVWARRKYKRFRRRERNCSGYGYCVGAASDTGSTGVISRAVRGSTCRIRKLVMRLSEAVTVRAIWGARCGKSVRRVLRGVRGTRRHAGSVRPLTRKGSNGEAPLRLQLQGPSLPATRFRTDG